MATVTTDNAHYTAIAQAIRAKTGATALYTPAQMAAAIQGITGAGGAPAAHAVLKDVNFYDYDGTLVAAYTLAEAQALTALPEGPAHDGLVFQGWNWTLDQVKALTRPMNVGALYITDDGKTRLHLRIWNAARSNVPLYFSQTADNGVTIDWGDGSPAETLAGTGNVNTTHAYAAVGDYTISLTVADGCTLGLGHGGSGSCVMGSASSTGIVYCNALRAVHIGTHVASIDDYAFYYCIALARITIPDGVTSIGSRAFYYCSSFVSVTFPDSVTSIGSYAFRSCASLVSAAIPHGVTSIGSYAFYYCYALASLTLPDGVISIGSYAFQNCYPLVSLAIPDGVTSIGSYAVAYCIALVSAAIPDSVTSIDDYAFYCCYSLTNLTIPGGVTSIGSHAFQYCYGMTEYHLLPTTPPALASTDALTGIPSDCIIYVPKGCLEAYKTAANWTAYADYMQEEDAS